MQAEADLAWVIDQGEPPSRYPSSGSTSVRVGDAFLRNFSELRSPNLRGSDIFAATPVT